MRLGVDIGGDTIKTGVFDENFAPVDFASYPTEADSGKERIIVNIENAIVDRIQAGFNIESIGVGAPGVVDGDGVVIVAPNLAGWENVPLLDILKKRFNMPVAIDNDANVAALAEAKLGAGRDLPYFLYATLGTGVGGAIIADGKLFKGAGGGAGEIGHLIVDKNADVSLFERSYRAGTLEEFAGRRQIVDFAKKLLKDYPGSPLSNIKDLSVKDVSDAAYEGDAAALECLRQTGETLGIGFATAMNLLDIRDVVIGGGVSRAHKSLFESILNAIRLRALPSVAKNASIRKARFLNDAGAIGAAVLGAKI